MTVKKCDACSKVYEKGYIFAYSLDSYEVNKANTQTKFGYALTKDLCENCANRLKMFLLSLMVKDEVKK